MSSYLLRLAAGAIQPALVLHPLVGSLFAGPAHDQHAAAEPRDDTRTEATHRNSGQDAAFPTRVDAPPYPARRDDDLPHSRDEAQTHVPLVAPLTVDSTLRQHAPDPSLARGAASDTPGAVAASRAAASDPLVTTARDDIARPAPFDTRAPVPPGIAPLVTGDAPPAPRPSPIGSTPTRINSGPAFATTALSTRPQAPDSLAARRRPFQADPGEIQIHIGRIEVIAVPPPAPRPAAPPARRAMSLDDYLKRRNGGGS